MDLNDLKTSFLQNYAPYKISGFVMKPRTEIAEPQGEMNGEKALISYVERQRVTDPMIGAKLAGREILENLMQIIKSDKGIHFESLFAYLGSMAGRECSEGLIDSLKTIIPEPTLRTRFAGAIDMMIAETSNGGRFLMGDRVGNAFFEFYINALANPNLKPEMLLNIAAAAAATAGSDAYWKTKYADMVRYSPKEIAEFLKKIPFEKSLQTYCRYPHERLMAYAFATQRAIKTVQSNKILGVDKNPSDRAADILAEYGWRTAHYIWNW
ncbi:MAG: hypothetical protein ACI4M3_09390 [Acutalibacteraceae bacterium]